MKKIILLGSLFMTSFLQAQISLENTYNAGSTGASLTIIDLANSGKKYMMTDVTSGNIKLYNLNHSLWKTINFPTIAGFSPIYPYNVSEHLFNLDNQIEVLMVYMNTSTNPATLQTRIFNEVGTTVADFPNRNFHNIVDAGANGWKLLLTDGNLTREVYSVPGTSSNLGINDDNEISTSELLAYPNPGSTVLNIPYELNNGGNGQITIYSSTGQIIESFTVDSNFNNLVLDISNYGIGSYYYQVSSNGILSSTIPFVKN